MPKLSSQRLGSGKLGVPITPTQLPAPEETPRERATDIVKSAHPTGDGTVWDRFLTTLTDEFEREYTAIREIESQRDVETAIGAPLEKVGGLVHVTRRQGETDTHLRRRIKLQLPKHTTSATLDEVLENSTMLLDCEYDQLELHETFDIEAARFDVFIREQVLRDANVTVGEYIGLLEDVKAAGVRAVATIGKQFTHRSEYEFQNGINDPDRGYASEDGSVPGAPYADLITAKHRTASDFDEEAAPKKPDYDGYGEGRFGESIYGV